MDDYQDRLAITTPEGVELQLELAGPGTRIVSGLADLVLQLVVAVIGLVVLGALSEDIGDDWTIAIASVLAFLLIFFWDVAWELANDGRTPGKAALGLRVVRDDGRRVDPASSVVRNLLRIIELPLAYAPGIAMVTLTRRHQRVGDLLGGTLVVREPRRASVALGRPAATAAPATPAVDDQAAPRLDTAALTDHDRSTARAFAARHATLDPAERERLAAAIGGALRQRVGGVPPDLSDEQLVLAVARGTSLRG
ncbi:RDD family protein [Patulibacter defluvii]|uniref:RDD family protein n=1 Tax=Patulibacter defluvii TaxID=3095358 RepID=UPI002A74A43E|nr:RDD family protein [Patulibacter sp. DM4]